MIDDLRITTDVRYPASFTPGNYNDDYPPYEGVIEGKVIKMTAIPAIPANQEPRSAFQPQDVVWRGSPGAVYAGLIPAAAVTTDPLCQARI